MGTVPLLIIAGAVTYWQSLQGKVSTDNAYVQQDKVSVPQMQAALGATSDEVSWVRTSYIVASAVAIPSTGWLADWFGSRRLLILTTNGFVISSMLFGVTRNITQMALLRTFREVLGGVYFAAQPVGDARHQQIVASGPDDCDLVDGVDGRSDFAVDHRRLAD